MTIENCVTVISTMLPEEGSFNGSFLAEIEDAHVLNDTPWAIAQMTNNEPNPTGNMAGKSVAESWLNNIMMMMPTVMDMDSGKTQILKLVNNLFNLD